MNIWFDSHTIADNNKDCDCTVAPFSHIAPLSLLDSANEQAVNDLVLQRNSSLHVHQFDNERWLVSSPASLGRLALLDHEAMKLLDHFSFPVSVTQLCHRTSLWSHEHIRQAVEVFYSLGFLQWQENNASTCTSDITNVLTAWLHVTNVCNLRCTYCYLEKTSNSMLPDTRRQAVDAVFRSARLHHMRKVRLKYAGGEASLHMKNVLMLHDYALQLANQYNIELSAVLLSNGVALSQRAIEELKARSIEVTISLDGLGAYHDSQRGFISGKGSSQYVLRTIGKLLANHLMPHIAITVSGQNLEGLIELMHYILEQKLLFTISYYRENACSTHIEKLRFEEKRMITAMKQVFGVIEQSLPERSLLGSLLDRTDLRAGHDYTCGVGQNYLVIDQHGGVAKCQADIKRTVTTIAVTDPLHAIQVDRKGIQAYPVSQKSGCQTCQWRHWCTGGCPLLTYRATGRYDIQSPNCHIYQALFPEVVRLEALRLLRYTSPLVLEKN